MRAAQRGAAMRGAVPRQAAAAPSEPVSVGFIEGVPAAAGRFNTVGAIDCLLGAAVLGWAYDRDVPRRRAKITLHVDGEPVAETVANGLRREMVGVGGHDGFSGFICTIPPENFRPGAAVRIFADGTPLGAEPLILGPLQIDGVVEPISGAVISGWARERVLGPARAILELWVDDAPVRSIAADRPRPELQQNGIDDGCFGFAEPLPDECLDGSEHRIELRHAASGRLLPPGATRFRAGFEGSLERFDQHGGEGWVYCREASDRPVKLDVVVNGVRTGTIADHPRRDVQAASGVLHCGFHFAIPDSVTRHRELSVEIRVAGTTNPAIRGPFLHTPASRLIERLEQAAAQAGMPGEVYSPLRETIIPGVIAALRANGGHPERTVTLPLDSAPFKARPARVSDVVDIVIPVYGGHAETIDCIESVIRAANSTQRDIVVVDDCGPDPALREELRKFETAGAITLVVNAVNLGFPGAANAGMSLHPERDVILLNADTLVPDGWIDRLRAAAYREGNIGTATPLSNRATICSYPEINKDNELPADMSWDALDEICAGVNEGKSVDIPTAVGFCMYVRRAMLREVGLFDVSHWGKGYGEENELCIQAAARGWRHVLTPNLFVVHHGAVSFGTEGRKEALDKNIQLINRLFPDYAPRITDFLREDPVAPVRRAIDWARLKALASRFLLHVSHGGGGGTDLYVEDLARRLEARGEHALILEAKSDDAGVATLRNLVLGTRSVYALPGERDDLVADLRAAGIWHVHFHQVMGAERWARLPMQLGCPYDVTVHDYGFFCPRIDLVDENGRYCGEPSVDVCQRCVALGEPHPDLRDAYGGLGGTIADWVALHRRLLNGARRVFVPTRDVGRRMEQHLPGIEYRLRPHPEPPRRAEIRRPADRRAARVAVIGALGINKGCDLLLACARDALKRGLPIRFRLFGFTANETELRRLANVEIVGKYERAALPRLIAEHPCDLALFLSIWPETHCYALTDAYAAGLFPIALDFGALGERIATLAVGSRLPHDSTPGEVNAAILAAVAEAGEWPESVAIGAEYDDLLTDYYELAPPTARRSAAPSRL